MGLLASNPDEPETGQKDMKLPRHNYSLLFNPIDNQSAIYWCLISEQKHKHNQGVRAIDKNSKKIVSW